MILSNAFVTQLEVLIKERKLKTGNIRVVLLRSFSPRIIKFTFYFSLSTGFATECTVLHGHHGASTILCCCWKDLFLYIDRKLYLLIYLNAVPLTAVLDNVAPVAPALNMFTHPFTVKDDLQKRYLLLKEEK